MQNFINLLKSKGVRNLAIEIFIHNLEKLISNSSSYIKSEDIKPVEQTDGVYDEDFNLNQDYRYLEEMKKVAVIKLNGGLGTSMGLEGPKSQLIVKNDLNFIEITCNQIQKIRDIYNIQVPLIFMNSFNTNEETLQNLSKIHFQNINLPSCFNENKSPKLKKINFNNEVEYIPAKFPVNPNLEWAPPGHADIYPSLLESGLLDELIDKNYEFIFVSNVDNLGASLNLNIFKKIFDLNSDFVMEVALRTKNDNKGGHLALQNKKLILREVSQVSNEDIEDFQNYKKYKFFNTNSIWIKTKSLKELLIKNNGILDLPLIVNQKNIDPADSTSENIIQLETAMGSAISLFNNAKTILVPSKRFIPVKNTNNLLFLLSDLVKVLPNYELEPIRSIPIDLNPKYYKNVGSFYDRFREIPSLINCNSLKILTDKYFTKKEILEGDILI
jgi:UTP--glucose-1-phosphate uridylyltransferase